MKKLLVILITVAAVFISVVSMSAENKSQTTDSIKSNSNNKKVEGMWTNRRIFHIDGGILYSLAYYPGMDYSGANLAGNLAFSMRLTGLFDFSLCAGRWSFGIEPVIDLMSIELNNGTFYALDVEGRGFIRVSFDSIFLQAFGGYYYSVFGQPVLNGPEAGIRLALTGFVIDAYYVFARQGQVRVGFGYSGRIF